MRNRLRVGSRFDEELDQRNVQHPCESTEGTNRHVLPAALDAPNIRRLQPCLEPEPFLGQVRGSPQASKIPADQGSRVHRLRKGLSATHVPRLVGKCGPSPMAGFAAAAAVATGDRLFIIEMTFRRLP
jgi:hypothetical protein